jgi:TRAP-type C4-dicarboxylate transport system substrate-binding protein
VFTDGSQGGEAELSRRMRIGQLQGALMSVVGLREIEPSVAALQSLPLLFRSWEEVDHVREKMRPAMEKRFWTRASSWSAGATPAGCASSRRSRRCVRRLQGRKFFAWGSEPEQQAIMKSLGYTPVPLETADILPAIQTGMITCCPPRPTSRWPARSTARPAHAGDQLGAHRRRAGGHAKAWDGMSPPAQQALREAGEKAGLAMRAQARKEVDEAVAAMVKRGLSGAPPQRRPAARVARTGRAAVPAHPRHRWCRPRPSMRCSPT